MLNSKRFIFPSFDFNKFYDGIHVPSGEISWKLLHDVFDKDESLSCSNLKKAYKLSYKSLHPGDNKQSVPLALSIFHPTTSAAIKSYFPDRSDAAEFLNLINIWWTISNSKSQCNTNNRLGNAAVQNDFKPQFMRHLAAWITNWQNMQYANSQKFTLTKQTSLAFIVTLKCTASLLEDLFASGYNYVLTSRLQTDPLELRFSKYRQMSGGRFLVGLREVQISEGILSTISLLKGGINIWNENIRPDNHSENEITALKENLDLIINDIEKSVLDTDSHEVSNLVSGYIAKKFVEKTKCEDCQELLITSCDLENLDERNIFLTELSRGGLLVPSIAFSNFVGKSFAILDTVSPVLQKSSLPERFSAEYTVKNYNNVDIDFLCAKHINDSIHYIYRTISNIFFNNEQKRLCDSVRKDSVKDFKQRQTKRLKVS